MSDNSPGTRASRRGEQPRVQRGLPELIHREPHLEKFRARFPDVYVEGGDLAAQDNAIRSQLMRDYVSAVADYYGVSEDEANRQNLAFDFSKGFAGIEPTFSPEWENEAERQAWMSTHAEGHDGSTAEVYRLPPDTVPVMEALRNYQWAIRLLDPDHELTAAEVDIGENGGGEYWRRGNLPMNWFPDQRRSILPTSNGPAYFGAQDNSAMGEAMMAGRGDSLSGVANAMDPVLGIGAYRETMAGNYDTMGRNIAQTYAENVNKQGMGGVKTSQLPVFQEDGTPTTRIQRLLARRADDERYEKTYTGIDPEQHMTPLADAYGLSDKAVEKYAPTFDRATDYLDLTMLATIPVGAGAARSAAKAAARTFKPIAKGSRYYMPGSMGVLGKLGITYNEFGTELAQNELLAKGIENAMPEGEVPHWQGRKEGESRQSWHARNAIDRANTIQADIEADQEKPPLRVEHVKAAVNRGGPGFLDLIRRNKFLQHEALGVAAENQAKEDQRQEELVRPLSKLMMEHTGR